LGRLSLAVIGGVAAEDQWQLRLLDDT